MRGRGRTTRRLAVERRPSRSRSVCSELLCDVSSVALASHQSLCVAMMKGSCLALPVLADFLRRARPVRWWVLHRFSASEIRLAQCAQQQ